MNAIETSIVAALRRKWSIQMETLTDEEVLEQYILQESLPANDVSLRSALLQMVVDNASVPTSGETNAN